MGWSRRILVSYLLITLVCPLRVAIAGEQAAVSSTPSNSLAIDVQLHEDGSIRGQLFSAAGIPVGGVEVQLHSLNRNESLSVRTDEAGRFALVWGRTGAALVVAENGSCPLRIWDRSTAPPAARESLLLISGSEEVVRGQRPIGTLFGCQPLMLGVLIAAAVAIPLAIHDSGDRPAASN
jgi:hypothetical protein